MAVSLKLCQPSVLWKQRLNLKKKKEESFISFPSESQAVKIRRTRVFPSLRRETSVANKDGREKK